MRVVMTGGIACGKSLAAKYLNECGVRTVDADDIVHELIPIEERRRLARVVFKDEKARRELEARVHPLVKAKLAERLVPGPMDALPPIAIVPLLFEVQWEREFDIICCVRSERTHQVARMMAMRGYTHDEAESRLAAQMPVEEKASKSHYVIDNNGSGDELRCKVRGFVEWLRKECG